MKLRILSAILLATLVALVTPTETLAVVQNLNGQTGQTQTFQNDSNVIINSLNNIHSLGWQGLLPVSRGGTGTGSFTAGSLLFSNGTSISQDNSNLFWDDTNNRLSIGGTTPLGALSIQNVASGTNSYAQYVSASTGSTTNNYGLYINDQTVGTTSNYNIWSGPPLTAFDPKVQSVWFDTLGKNVFTFLDDPLVFGIAGSFLAQASSTDANALIGTSYVNMGGISAFGINTSAYSIAPAGQTVPIVAGLYTQNQNAGAGTVSELIGIQVDSNSNTDTGTTIDNYGIQIKNQYAGTNNYSIYTDQSSGTSHYALYNAGPAKSYFGGNVGIGTNNPNAKLDVAGTIRGNSTIFLGFSTAPGCIVMGDSDGSGVTYVTANDGVLTASTTKPSVCQ